jgi:pimeloyl-ACP methyl ester carboxylesterase
VPAIGRFVYLERMPPADQRRRGTLVLLHAFPLDSRVWEEQLALADHGWRVIAPDFRGFGSSGAADPPASSVDDYAGDVIDLLDRLHIDDAVIGGVSLGGYVAFAIFRHAPRYVRALMFVDTRSEADTPEGVIARQRMLRSLGEHGTMPIVEEMVPKLVGPTTLRSRPAIVERVRAMAMTSTPGAIAGAVQALMTRPDSTPLLSTIHCPVLIIVGEEDALTPVAFSERMQKAIGGAELAIIPGAGHLSNLERSDAFNAVATTFLNSRV